MTVQHDTTHLQPTYHYLIFSIFFFFFLLYIGFVARVYIFIFIFFGLGYGKRELGWIGSGFWICMYVDMYVWAIIVCKLVGL